MSKSKSKNDRAWEIIFEEEQILEVIARQGFFEISSMRINQQREARLMTKFDYATQRPDIFKKNNLSIQKLFLSSFRYQMIFFHFIVSVLLMIIYTIQFS